MTAVVRQIEIYLAVDGGGQFGFGHNPYEAQERLRNDCSGPISAIRVDKITVNVPLATVNTGPTINLAEQKDQPLSQDED